MARYLSFRNGGKTDEEGVARYVSKFLAGEVLDGLNVTQQSPVAMGVTVAAGDAMIPSGNDYPYIVWSDASINISLTAADGTNPRYDLIVGYVDLSVVSSVSPNNPNAFVIDNVTGTPAGSPVVPNLAAIEAVIGTGNPYIVLATILVATGAPSISNSAITDSRDMVSMGVEDETGGWNNLNVVPTVSSGYNKGNREYELTFPNVDLRTTLTLGDRLQVTRGTTAPTQCTDLESGSSQYWVKTTPSGITFTDDFTTEAWIWLESYTGAVQAIISRFNNTSGWLFFLETDGRVTLSGYNASGSNFRRGTTYQSIPLGRWVHVAATLNMSGSASTIYIDGVSVPVAFSQSGTNPSSLIQAGDLQVGAYNGATGPFDGKIADARVWSAVRTQTEINDNMNQQLVGSETNLVSYWKFNGNANDSTSNVNNLTSSGSATATNLNHPMRDVEYGIVHKIAYSAPNTTITVFTGIDHNIPNMTLSNAQFSDKKIPYGFPAARGKWRINSIIRTASSSTSNVTFGSFLLGGFTLTVGPGEWNVGWHCGSAASNSNAISVYFNLSRISLTGLSINAGVAVSPYTSEVLSPTASYYTMSVHHDLPQVHDSQVTYVMYSFGASTAAILNGSVSNTEIFAESAYV